ncbi:MAG: TolC family protein, partial [Armatimonadota bacterium]|nr:TolC family protein [Armatimonadota bacterium]
MRSFTCMLVTLTVLVLAAGTARTEKLTLSQSVAIALENNPAVHIAKENVRKADAMVEGAFSAAMPKVSLDGTYKRLDKAPTATFND